MKLDSYEEEYEMTGVNDQLDLEGPVYVGGVGTHHTMVPTQLWTAVLKYGFVGCFKDLVLNGQEVDIADLARMQQVSGVEEYCIEMSQMCPSRPCMHRGVCLEGWNRYICQCDATPYIGTTCNEGKTNFIYFITIILIMPTVSPSLQFLTELELTEYLHRGGL